MPGEFIARQGLISRGNVVVTGSLSTSGSLTTTGTITATTLVVQTITSSISSITGSTNFGSLLANTHTFTGSLNLTGSLTVNTTGTELQVNASGVNLGNALTDSHVISGSLRVNPNGLFVSSSGIIGIGTSSPNTKLQVEDGFISTYHNTNANGAGYGIQFYTNGGGSKNIIGEIAISQVGTARSGDIFFTTSNGGAPTTKLTISSTGAATFSSSVTAGGQIYVTAGNGNQMELDNTGQRYTQLNFRNSGTQRAFLAVDQTASEFQIYGQSGFALTLGAGGGEKMRITSGGNVGIGTTPATWSAGTTLEIGTTGNLALHNSAPIGNLIGFNTYYNGAFYYKQTSVALGYVQDSEGHKFYFNGSGGANTTFTPAERMRITSGGNVGIGTVSPIAYGGYIALTIGNNAANSVGLLKFRSFYNSGNGAEIFQQESGTLFFNTNGSFTGMTMTSNGNVSIVGSLSKGSGSFRIKHPLLSKKDTHQLVHSFIEGPQADLIYRGKIRLIAGRATINIDEAATMTEGTFEALCRDIQCFTSNETSWDNVKGKVEGNILTIESQNTESTDEISWLVIGERKDEHMIDTSWTDENGKVIVEPLITSNPENTTQEII